jgi:AraC-like DNA-binding protein
MGQPITSLAKPYPAGCHVPKHYHQRGQLMYAESGVGEVKTRGGIWILPPQCALWVPARMPHEVRMQTDVEARTLYLDRRLSADLGARTQVFFVSRLLRELILELARCQADRRERARVELITPLLVQELQRANRADIHIPWPSDTRLLRACEYLFEDPSRTDSVDLIAEIAGASTRTPARLSDRELRMPFARWRQLVRLANALNSVVMGGSIKKAAHDAGYKSCSAFIAMFRRALGVSPTAFVRRRRGNSPARFTAVPLG